jgi:hypothetical protein
VGSVSDVSQIQQREHVNQWVQSTWNLDRGYSEDGAHIELPGSFSFEEHLFPGTTSGAAEEQNDDIGSFFRAWREGQTERREEHAELS